MLERQRRIADRAARAVAADGVQLALARDRLVEEVRRELARPRTLVAALALGVAAGTLLRPRALTRPRADEREFDALAREPRRATVQRLGTAAVIVARIMDAYWSTTRR